MVAYVNIVQKYRYVYNFVNYCYLQVKTNYIQCSMDGESTTWTSNTVDDDVYIMK